MSCHPYAFLNKWSTGVRRVLSSSDALMLGGGLWVRVLDEAITPMLGQLALMVSRAPRDPSHGDADKSLRMGVVLETKVVLQYMDMLLPEPAFAALWARVLQVLQVSFQVALPAQLWTSVF
jgi:hypothetical protein